MRKLVYLFGTSAHTGLSQKANGQLASFQTVIPSYLVSFQDRPHVSWAKRGSNALRYQIRALVHAVKASHVYTRYNPKLAILNLGLLLLSFFKPVYMEHNINLTTELRFLGRVCELKLHRLTIWLLQRFPIFHICVSGEIKTALNQMGLPLKQLMVIPNGYTPPTVIQSEVNLPILDKVKSWAETGKKIGIFTGNGYPWHGLDEAIRLIQAHPESRLIVVGPYPLFADTDQLYVVGRQTLSTLWTLYPYCHFGIGPLRWDRIGITEGSPLKTREYLSAGLPVLVNYHDLASEIPSLAPYFFNLQTHPDALDQLLNASFDAAAIQAEAQKNLSWVSTMRPLLEQLAV